MKNLKVGQSARVMYLAKDEGLLLCEVRVTRRRGFYLVDEDRVRGREILGDKGKAGHRLRGTLSELYPEEIRCVASGYRGLYRRAVEA